ncbi:hypothetical protein ANTRET_LOCUS100 [Anthophora retusa]
MTQAITITLCTTIMYRSSNITKDLSGKSDLGHKRPTQTLDLSREVTSSVKPTTSLPKQWIKRRIVMEKKKKKYSDIRSAYGRSKKKLRCCNE